MPQATANGGTSRRARLRRAVLRLLIASGAIVAVWLIAPSAASADEPSGLGDLLGGATDAVGDTVGGVTGVLDDVVETTTETVEQVAAPVEQVTGVATGAVAQVTDGATDTVEQVTGAVEQVTDVATSTVEEILDTTTGAVEEVLDTATGTVEETFEAVTAAPQDPPPAGTVDEPAVPDSRHAAGAVVWETERRPLAEDPVPSELPAPRGGFQVAATSGARASAGDASPNPGASEPGPGPFAPGSPAASGGSTLTDLGTSQTLRNPSSSQDVGVLSTMILIALVLVRWSRREAELRLSPAFLSLPERPG